MDIVRFDTMLNYISWRSNINRETKSKQSYKVGFRDEVSSVLKKIESRRDANTKYRLKFESYKRRSSN